MLYNLVMRFQKTLKREVFCEGIGLHTGVDVSLRLLPAPPESGIVFWRRDRGILIRADAFSVNETSFATTIGSGVTRIKTVEHLLSAISGLGIDNLLIEVNGPEIPILDGSSAPFVRLMLKAGIVSQSAAKKKIKIIKPFEFKEGSSELWVSPYEGTFITYKSSYKHKLLGNQSLSINLDEEVYIKEIAPARTFGFLKDVELMRANGLAKGGSLENAVLFDENGVINEDGLRFKDECIRHKVLDLIGDLSLLGYPIEGKIVAIKTGHSVNIKFLRALLSMPDCWQIESDEPSIMPLPIYSQQNLI